MSKKNRGEQGSEAIMGASPEQPAAQAPPAETKAEKFRRLANRRVAAAIKHIRYCRNLSAKGSYEYTPAQAADVVAYLRREVDALEQDFTAPAKAAPQANLF